jgi:hypothetical protein
MGMATANISNGVNGEVISFGTLTGLDTRGDTSSAIAVGDETWAEGDILFAHPTVAGKLTKVRPQHDLAVAFITVHHASTGQIAVRIVPGNNHLEWMHDVLISGSVQNNEILSYSSASGAWTNKTPVQAGIATYTDLVDYLTVDDAILFYQPLSPRLTSLTTVENVAGFVVSDGSASYAIDISEYLTTSSASSIYLEQLDAADIYLTQTDAENTYITTASAASTYQPLDQDLTAISSVSGSGFLRRNIVNNWEFDANTYLTTYGAGITYQPIGDYATINEIETLSNKTMSSAFIPDVLTFDDGANSSTIDVTGDNLTINAYDDLYLTTTIGDIVLQPDHFVKIYDEYVATQEWVNFQDYLTEASASTIYQPIGSYSTTSHNHSLDGLSNVVITGTPTDGQAIVWDTSTSKWVNETVSGGGASYPDQTGNNGKFLQTNGASVSWQNVNFTGYLTESSASTIYLTQASASSTYQPIGSYLTSESDTFETVTDRGASSTNAITISNTTQSTTPTTGALIISGGVGIAKDVWIDGDLHVNGTTVTENTKTVATHDNLIYLNAALDSTITNAVFASGSITYTAENLYTAGMDIRVTGVDPAGFNIATGDNLTVASATPTSFIVIKANPGSSYVSGGTAHAKEEANPDLGFAGGYYNAGYAHAGLFRDASDGIFKFFQGYTPEPDEEVNIDTTHASFALADISANSLTLSGDIAINGGDLTTSQTTINLFNGANTVNLGTNSSFVNIGKSVLSSGVVNINGTVNMQEIVSGSATIDDLILTNPLSYEYGGTGLTTLGTAGQVLKVNSGATALEWGTVDALPSQSGNNGKYLTTNGSTASWGTLDLSLYLTLSSASTTYATILSPTLTTPNIGAATGTSLTTTGNVISHVDISTPTFVTNSYTITSTDDGKLLMLNNSTTAGNLLIPTDATFNFPIGTQINVVQQGTGLITIGAVTPATTTINATPGKKLRAQWSSAAIVKTAANTWLLMGDLTV